MSTHPDSDDLDRTDELPQLDVVAYEAANPPDATDALSSTDAWLVEPFGERETETIVRTGQTGIAVPGGVDLSLNVERLRQRIDSLEAELTTARRATHAGTSRVPSAERNELQARIATLEAQNAHLIEQQTLAAALTQRLQQQLSEQAEAQKSQLAKADEMREADRHAAERQRVTLEQQLDRSTAHSSNTADEHVRLRQALDESRELAAARARQIDELQRQLINEHGKTHALGRNLAAKLADHDIMSSMVSQRNMTIAAMERAHEELNEQLQQAFADAHRLGTLLEEANHRAESGERQGAEAAARERQIAQLGIEIESLRHQGQQSLLMRQALEANLQDAATQSALTQEREATLQSQIEQLESSLQSIAQERDRLLDDRRELAARSTELSQVAAELAAVKRDAASVWSELEAQSGVAQTRQHELTALQAALADLQRVNTELQRKVDRAHAASSDETQLLNDRTTELAQMRADLHEFQAAQQGLESSLRARDTLIEKLRAEVRTAQEERSIVTEQLGKARARVKTMNQQLFNRDNRIATLKADLAVHIEALAAIRQDVDQMTPDATAAEALPVERFLEPVDHDGDNILLNRRVMTIGRTNDNDIFIPSKMISRHHARLLVGPNAVIVEDAGSTNGCYVNDQLIKQHVLHEGDVLSIGDLKFRLGMRALPAQGSGEVVALRPGRRRDD